MPEGHLIHWLARRHRRVLAGRTVAVTSPQGRFRGGARLLNGGTLRDVDAYGKHLLYLWGGERTLHVHLGQAGRFLERPTQAGPIPQARVSFSADGAAVDLVAPARCEILDATGVEALIGRLGPDPLRRAADPEPAFDRISSSARPIGALLLDQGIVAGVGNVLRAEVLNLERLHPDTPGRALSRDDLERLWGTLVTVMRAAARRGWIVNVPGAEGQDDGRYVYKQERCRRCGTPVERWLLAARTMYACPACQPRARLPAALAGTEASRTPGTVE